MTTTKNDTKSFPTTVKNLRQGDVIVNPDPALNATVTGPTRRLGGTGLVAIPLERDGQTWDGRLAATDKVRRLVSLA